MSRSPGDHTPDEARALFRGGLRTPTAGWCTGHTQANLLAVPREQAYDVLLFAQRNPRSCPVLDVSEPGATSTSIFGGDLRTDLPAYRVYVDGEAAGDVADVTGWWRDDLVAFLIGCSFTFEDALLAAGVPVRHLEQGCNVPTYRTTVACRGAGALHGPLVVSMRPVRPEWIATAVRVTARYPAVHGAPVHVGAPAALGIADLDRPDFGDPVEIRGDEVPVFWACGVTPQAAVMASRPPLAIGHAPATWRSPTAATSIWWCRRPRRRSGALLPRGRVEGTRRPTAAAGRQGRSSSARRIPGASVGRPRDRAAARRRRS